MTKNKEPLFRTNKSVYQDEHIPEWVKRFYNSTRWRKLSKRVFKKYKGTCDACYYGYKDENDEWIIEPQHKITVVGVEHGVKWSSHHKIELTYPPETNTNWAMSNLVLLCEHCHSIVHGKTEYLQILNNQKRQQRIENEQNELREKLSATNVVSVEDFFG